MSRRSDYLARECVANDQKIERLEATLRHRDATIDRLSRDCWAIQAQLVNWIQRLTSDRLVELRDEIVAELQRRDVCGHGIETGEYCESCNAEHKRAAKENSPDADT